MNLTTFKKSFELVVKHQEAELLEILLSTKNLADNLKAEVSNRSDNIRRASVLLKRTKRELISKIEVIDQNIAEENEKLIIDKYNTFEVLQNRSLAKIKEYKKQKKIFENKIASAENIAKRHGQNLVDLYLEINQVVFKQQIVENAITIRSNTMKQGIYFNEQSLENIEEVFNYLKIRNII